MIKSVQYKDCKHDSRMEFASSLHNNRNIMQQYIIGILVNVCEYP